MRLNRSVGENSPTANTMRKKIVKIKYLLLTAILLAISSTGFAQSKTKEIAPETVIKNLYAAHKNAKTSPFFQNKNRALLDRYFNAFFIGDNLWADAVAAGQGKSSAINFDPMFSSQNPQTTAFTISRDKTLGDADNVWVDVTFKNAGKAEEARFEMRRDDDKNWKIINIYYSDRPDLSTILRYSQEAEFRAEEDKDTFFKGDYLIGAVKCTFLPIDPLVFRAKCADRKDYQKYFVRSDGIIANLDETEEKRAKPSEFIVDEDSGEITFKDTSGKTVKVTRIESNKSSFMSGSGVSLTANFTGSGELEIGEGESLITQSDEAAADYAAYCFTNKSVVGRQILAKCKNRQRCEFTGTVETGECKTPDYLKPPVSSRRITAIASVKFVATNPVTAKKGTIEHLAQTLAAAFESGTMSSLDAEKPYLKTVKLVFEDSLSDGKTSTTYKTLQAAEQAFRGKNETGNFASHQFQNCANGVCSFEGGVVHNTLFLHKITYTVVKGRPYIKAIHFITG